MSQVLARFRLVEVTRTPYYITKSGQEMTVEEATRVKLALVKGEPFGSAPPQGNIDALIVNPEATRVFLDAPINQEFSILFTPV